MIADFTRALNESGTLAVIDSGDPVLVFIGPVEEVPSPVENLIISRMKVFHLDGAVERKVAGQLVDIGGEEWTVLSHRRGKCSICLSVERILS
jgi:hypothetical protein